MVELYCPYCQIGIDYQQMKARKCNNCLHEWEIFHVMPNNDEKEHLESYVCHCLPKIEHESGNMIVIHNAFDGREGVEWVNDLLKTP